MAQDSTIVVYLQYIFQAALAAIVAIVLRRFYKNYSQDYFQYWSWSWMALGMYLVLSLLSIVNSYVFEQTSVVRILTSMSTIAAGFVQLFWLYAGSYELIKKQKFNRKLFKVFSISCIPISGLLVFAFLGTPEAYALRVLLRVGVLALAGGISFLVSAVLIAPLRKLSVGMHFIFVAFLLYGVLKLNYFVTCLSYASGFSYPLSIPYYSGMGELFLQAVMGVGMIIGMLEQEQYKLRKANTELDTFLYRSSHDLRAPLTTMAAIVQVLKMEKNEEKQQHYLELISGKIEQADSVIRDIISLRKDQKLDITVQKIDVAKEFENEFHRLRGLQLEPTLQIEAVGDCTVHTDLDRLKTVFTNLISNSIRYHNYDQPTPFLKLYTERVSNGIRVEISDNGIGISQQSLPRIFDMFYRASTTSNGSGLGLYLVKETLHKLQSTISVDSHQGEGTVFVLFLKDLA